MAKSNVDRILKLTQTISKAERSKLAGTLLLFTAIEVDGNDPCRVIDAFAQAAKETLDDMMTGRLPGILEVDGEKT